MTIKLTLIIVIIQNNDDNNANNTYTNDILLIIIRITYKTITDFVANNGYVRGCSCDVAITIVLVPHPIRCCLATLIKNP